MKLVDLARTLQLDFQGDGNIEIRAVRSLEQAGPGDITFVVDKKYRKQFEAANASVYILPMDFQPTDRPAIRTDNPYNIFARTLELFYRPPLPEGPFVHPTAVLAGDVVMGEKCYIGAHVVIESGVRLGDRVRILPNCTIYPEVRIGSDVLVHSNCVIREYCVIGNNVVLQNGVIVGADGFGFALLADGSYYKIPQAGKAVIENDVEIQANACVDRGVLTDTRVAKGTKVDNLVQIAHGCDIGENCVLAAQVGLSGSVKVGRNVRFGGQVGVADHITIGDNAVLMAQCGVPSSVESGAIVLGSPAIGHRAYWRSMSIVYNKLPEMVEKLQQLEKEIEGLKQPDDGTS